MRIITHLMGGLGNQLFQYAAGRALNIANPGSALHVHFEDGYRLMRRQFALGPFAVSAGQATPQLLKEVGPHRGVVRRIRKTLGLPVEENVYRERETFVFDGNMLMRKADTYLIGFWQSHRYLESIRPQLLQEFSLRQESDNFKAWKRKLHQAEVPVMVHFRRTDYAQSASEFYMLPEAYYHRAIEALDRQFPSADYFFFSDDPAWLSRNVLQSFKGKHELVSGNGLSESDELTLMSMCKHAIMANSTFSWWGAWKMTNPDKVVYYPSRWLVDPTKRVKDLIPPAWRSMEV